MEGSPRGRRTVQVARGGKLNKPNELCGTVIRLQRVCGQPCLCCGRGRSNHGVCTGVLRGWSWPKRPESSIAFGATSALPTVFPSLRAHEPLSCRGRDPSGPGRLTNLNLISCEPDYWRRKQEGKLVKPGPDRRAVKDRQFTNRRMRTFIATPSARNVNNTEDPP